MIVLTVSNSSPVVGSGIKCHDGKTPLPTTVSSQDVIDFCFCDFECEYTEKALVNLGDTAKTDENDKTRVLEVLNDSNGSVDFFLVDAGNNETPLIDNTYGTFFDLGFAAQNDNKKGYEIQWHLVASAFGYGKYRIKKVINAFNNDSELLSYWYDVQPYTPQIANETVSLNFQPDGYIENGIDYRYLNWEYQIRVKGELRKLQPSIEINEYEDGDWSNQQIEIRQFDEFDLDIRQVPEDIFKPFFKDYMVSNGFYVSDYNLFNPIQKVRDLSVSLVEIGDFVTTEGTRNVSFTVKIAEKDRATIKRQN